MEIKHVSGINRGNILLYALSTCIWCKRIKRLLNELGVEYNYIDVDLLEGEESAMIKQELKKLNPQESFPTIVIDEEKVLINFVEDKIREVLGNEK